MTSDPLIIGCWMLVWLFSVTVHETAHGWTAWRLGDSTAYHGGQAAFDPLPHMMREPIGMVIVPLISIIFFGYPMGWASVPIDPEWMQRNPRFSAVVSMAGPLANLIIVIVAGVLLKLGLSYDVFEVVRASKLVDLMTAPEAGLALFAVKMLSMLLIINIILFGFNLLPFPPLDGSAIPLFFLSNDEANTYFSYIYHPTFQMVGMLAVWYLSPYVLSPLIRFVFMLVIT
ncbi:MAG: site-2 protease family protein [Candidatus Methylacidiphilales bacterium]|nr:site-2 protease family protein [Candidatus Methylacidiphilales bacterium]